MDWLEIVEIVPSLDEMISEIQQIIPDAKVESLPDEDRYDLVITAPEDPWGVGQTEAITFDQLRALSELLHTTLLDLEKRPVIGPHTELTGPWTAGHEYSVWVRWQKDDR